MSEQSDSSSVTNVSSSTRVPEPLVDPLFVHITKRLRHIGHELDKYSKYLQESHKVTVPQLITLREIYEHGPISLSGLTRVVSLNNSTITGIVDRLARQGLVERTRTSADRRRIDVVITDDGVEFLTRVPPPIPQSVIDGLQNLSHEQTEQILWSIETILELLHARESGPDA